MSEAAKIRVCAFTGCNFRMSSVDEYPHLLCPAHVGWLCSLDKRCDTCKDWPDEQKLITSVVADTESVPSENRSLSMDSVIGYDSWGFPSRKSRAKDFFLPVKSSKLKDSGIVRAQVHRSASPKVRETGVQCDRPISLPTVL